MKDFVQILALAMLVYIAATSLRMYKRQLLEMVSGLVNKAEEAIQGSGMGAEKKAIVIAQLEAAGIRVTAWLSNQTDAIVAALNASGAWLATQAKQAANGMSDGDSGAKKPASKTSGGNV